MQHVLSKRLQVSTVLTLLLCSLVCLVVCFHTPPMYFIFHIHHKHTVMRVAGAPGGGAEGPKKQVKPHGTALPAGLHIAYDVDARAGGEAQRQLEVTPQLQAHLVCIAPSCGVAYHVNWQRCLKCAHCAPFARMQVAPITMYNSEFALELRRQIAVSAHYICYALRQGQLRLLHRHSAERALLKSKGAAITDVQCGPPKPRLHLLRVSVVFTPYAFLFVASIGKPIEHYCLLEYELPALAANDGGLFWRPRQPIPCCDLHCT